MAKKLKVVFAGARRSGSFFQAFQNHPATQIVALCDLHEPTLLEIGKTTHITSLYTNYEKMLDEVQPDIVVVATPMHYHVAQSIAALQRHIHVLCEVTAAVSLDECRWLVAACKRSSAIYMMAENVIYRKPVVLLQAMVEAGLFGETYYEDYCKDPNEWLPLEQFEAKFLPELWRNPPPEALAAGHEGGDYFEVMDFVAAVQGKKPPTIGIHQAMDMTLPGRISQESIRQGGAWLDVPDSREW